MDLDEKQSDIFRELMFLFVQFWCRSKSGSSAFKCGFTRGLLGLGGGMNSSFI